MCFIQTLLQIIITCNRYRDGLKETTLESQKWVVLVHNIKVPVTNNNLHLNSVANN